MYFVQKKYKSPIYDFLLQIYNYSILINVDQNELSDEDSIALNKIGPIWCVYADISLYAKNIRPFVEFDIFHGYILMFRKLHEKHTKVLISVGITKDISDIITSYYLNILT